MARARRETRTARTTGARPEPTSSARAPRGADATTPAVDAPAADVARRAGLPALLALSVAVSLFNLWRDWYTDPYFAAAVQSMLTSWRAFFFVSFDPAGFVSVDKPPLDLWLQAASAKALGFNPFSLLLPQALAGVLSVVLLYYLVRRAFGHGAGLLAGLMLTITPIDVAMNRSNNADSLVVLAVLAGAWAMSVAAENGRLPPLLLCALALGLGFNVKWLQALLVAPAFALVYLLSPVIPWRARLSRLALALGVLAVVSLSWATVVDLTPSAQRPYVGSSANNTELDLALGYGGLSRLGTGSTVASAFAGRVGNAPGDPGPLRLFDAQVGGQVSWLLPLALVGLALAAFSLWRPVRPARHEQSAARDSRAIAPPTRAFSVRERQAMILWGAWLLWESLVFSVAGFFHPYNLAMLAPAICALAAIGLIWSWREYRRRGGTGWPLTTAIAGTALAQAAIVAESPAWLPWLVPLIVGAALVIAAALGLMRLATRSHTMPTVVMGAGALALLIAPALWSSVPLWHYGNVELPVAGPDLLDASVEAPASARHFFAPPAFTRFLLANHRRERFVLAVRYAGVAAPVMLATEQAVMTYGGYLGLDHILMPDQLARLVALGEARFFWQLPLQTGAPGQDVERWVATHCAPVAPRLWQDVGPGAGAGARGPQLFDCANAASRRRG